jgi:hypothetical protein
MAGCVARVAWGVQWGIQVVFQGSQWRHALRPALKVMHDQTPIPGKADTQ